MRLGCKTRSYPDCVPRSTDPADSFEVHCPHCKKQFTAELIAGSAERYRGFKCPHCKLFVPLQRADRT